MRTRSGPRSCALRLVAAGWLAVASASGADPDPATTNPALAEALFREGKQLAGAGDFAQACPKQADSQRLDPGGGTVLALAHCYEAQGRVASAWAAFNDAIAFAQRDGRADRETEARSRLAAIEPRLCWIELAVAAPLPDLELRHDGQLVPRSAWASRLPVDPGTHRFEARAAGRTPWSISVQAVEEGATVAVRVPALEASRPAAGVVPHRRQRPPASRRDSFSASHQWGWSALAGGVAAMSVGAYFGILALSDDRTADEACAGARCDDRAAVDRSGRAARLATISTVAFGVGITSVATGGALLALTPSRTPSNVGLHISGGFQ